jgi:hypothetical protein
MTFANLISMSGTVKSVVAETLPDKDTLPEIG